MRFTVPLAALAAACVAAPALAQTPPEEPAMPPGPGGAPFAPPPAPPGGGDLQNLLSGSPFPLTVKLRAMDPTWRVLNVGGQLDTGGAMKVAQQVVSSLLGGTLGGSYYTHGQMVAMGGETYLVAYALRPLRLDLSRVMEEQKPPKLPVLTPDTDVTLSLLNLRTSGSFNDIHPFDMQAEIADSQKQGLVEQLMDKEKGTGNAAKKPPTPGKSGAGRPAHPKPAK